MNGKKDNPELLFMMKKLVEKLVTYANTQWRHLLVFHKCNILLTLTASPIICSYRIKSNILLF